MFTTRTLLLTAVLPVVLGRTAAAQGVSITDSGDPAAMTIKTAVAGSQPTSVSNNATTYSTTQFAGTRRVTAQLGANMPAGVTLTVSLAVGAGATSVGAVALDVTARNVVTNMTQNQTSRTITYQLSALASAGVVTSQTRIVTFTFTT